MKKIIKKVTESKLTVLETQAASHLIKTTFAQALSKEIGLTKVSAPLFLDEASGLQDNLNGIEPPVAFRTATGEKCQIVHSLAKWKRHAIAKYEVPVGKGIYADMMAVRTTEDLDSIHSYYVDQWDWEASIKKSERNFETLKKYVTKIVGALAATQEVVLKKYPELQRVIAKKPIKFITTQELEDRWPKLSSKEREHAIAREYKGTLFISQIGGKLKSGKIHDGRSPDYDDWSLNGDIVIYYPPFDSSLELSSMGIRVDAVALKSQLAERKALDRMKYDFHKKLLAETLPFTIGGGIGQSRVCMVLLNKTHIGEVQASQWSDEVVSDAKKRKIALL